MPTKAAETEMRALAWVGDAVLALFAREWLLGRPEYGNTKAREEAFKRLTSNGFLSGLGAPEAVEAQVGRIYRESGLEAAATHIEAAILPLFMKQEHRRLAANQGNKRR